MLQAPATVVKYGAGMLGANTMSTTLATTRRMPTMPSARNSFAAASDFSFCAIAKE